MTAIKTPKKLIEVALPLDDINDASGKEKSIRHGHPSTLHMWWARRPLAAARAVIFAQMVNDPGYERSLGRGVNKKQAQQERERLFGIIRKLVQWDNTDNESVLNEARAEIKKSWRETCDLNRGHPEAATLFNPDLLPEFHDPFAGGGALPLEAQRLALNSYASDLNPVAVLINKGMIEFPTLFAGRPPVGKIHDSVKQSKLALDWSGSKGIAEDVRRYGAWVRDEAFKRIGGLYPQIALPKKFGGGTGQVVAALWARTVKSPNPAYSHVDVPLLSSYVLNSNAGKEMWVEPVIKNDSYKFEVREGKPPASVAQGTSAGKRNAFLCLLSGVAIDYNYIREQGKAGKLGQKLFALLVDTPSGRVYMSPDQEQETQAKSVSPIWRPDTSLPEKALSFRVQEYGMTKWGDLFTSRQLTALATFSDVIQDVRRLIERDAIAAGWAESGQGIEERGDGPKAYAAAVSTYLAFAANKCADYWCTIATWMPRGTVGHAFSKQAIPMTWDFPEANPFAEFHCSWDEAYGWVAKSIEKLAAQGAGWVEQADASTQQISINKLVSTDPPYYDNIGYADLSDFFYPWLRRSLREVFPRLFSTMAVPKAEELVATPFRHGSKAAAETFFLDGMTGAMHRLAEQAHPAFPTTIYYAFKQSDTTDAGTGNTGWETFLEAVLRAGFCLTGTWPIRTERGARSVGIGTNALASSIVLVCRPREKNAQTISRRDFVRELKEELDEAVEVMIGGSDGISPVAPVDLAQAVIGPGMAIFSKYAAVLEADGSSMSVHSALTIINRMLTEGSDEFDADTQFCLAWFDGHGWSSGEYGTALVLAQAKGTVVDRVRDAGVIEAAGGKVRLLKHSEYPDDWLPENDNNTPVWEALHQLIRELRAQGETAAGALLAGMPERAEPIRSLAYRLYTLCERKAWADDARAYNELITSWTGIEAASHEKGHLGSQTKLDI
jgi:putative DNA methylase